MTEIITVCFKPGGKQYFFAPNGLTVQPGQGVIVETGGGIELARCVKGNAQVDERELLAPLRPVVRLATPEDEATARRNKEREKTAFAVCQEKIAQHGLDMKLVEAQCSFEGNKTVFFFTSEGRVDFRALVKDLATTLHARIELWQIGVRDEAKMLGGLGICGRPFCCAQFLDEFQPVSIKMAKTQNLSLNPTKISGTCGRLMCCLKYEQEAYEDLVKSMPKAESFVETPDGVGTVSAVNLLRSRVSVRLENDPDGAHSYRSDEIVVVRNGKGKRPEGYVAPPPEELAKLRKTDAVPPCQKQEDWFDFRGAPDSVPVASAPAPAESAEQTEQTEQKPSGHRHRRGRGHGKGGAAQGGQNAKPAAPQDAAPKPAAESGEGAPKKSRPHHRRRRGGQGKPQGGQEK